MRDSTNSAHSIAKYALAAFLAVFGLGCDERPSGPEMGKTLFGYCVQCHSEDGSGNRLFEAPSIAGQSAWYVEAQLRKFQSGARGDHPDDVAGLKMRPMSRVLVSDEEIAAVAEYVASLTPVVTEPVLEGGDPEKGASLYTTCVVCHDDRAQGKQDVSSPNLTRIPDWYMLSQLKKFKEGVRGADPLDVTGAQMRPMAIGLSDEQAMKDVIAYIRTLK